MSGRERLGRIARLLRTEATRPIRARAGGIVLLVVAASVLTALAPVVLKYIVDALTDHRDGSVRLPVLASLYVLALWLARTANEIRAAVFARMEQRIYRSLSERLFAHLMRLPLRFHLSRQTGAVSQTLNNSLEGLRIILRHMVFTIMPLTVELATIFIVIAGLVTGPFVAMFCGAVVCYVTTFAYSAATLTKVARSASNARIEATAAITDGLLNYETVKYFAAESLVHDRVARGLRRSESEWIRFYRRYAANGLVVAGIFAMFLAGTILYSSEEVRRNHMTLGNFVLINTYMIQVVRPIEMVGYAIQGVSQGVAMLDKLVQLFGERTEDGLLGGQARALGPGSVEFRDVSVSYGASRNALTAVSVSVMAGHTLGIVGPSGSGKSTIVRLLMRLLEPESGLILLDGVPIGGMSLRDLRRAIAVVPQDTLLFDDTLRYNIAFGRADAGSDEIESAARVAQLHEFVMTLPDGYETVVGERGVKLSGGERQRVSIARAVLKAPKIYVFDEATSSLDSRTEGEILRNLRAISRQNTTLVIAHRLSTVIHADEIVVLESGQITERGTHDSLLRYDGRYAALWKAQQEGAAAA